MERTLTAVATALWVAPVCAVGTMALVLKLFPLRGGADDQIATSMLNLLAGLVVGAAAFGATFWLVRARVPEGRLRALQVADGVVLAALAGSAAVLRSRDAARPAPQYDRAWARLEVEVRVAKSLLAGKRLTDEISVSFGSGDSMESPHPERIRDEGDALVLPVDVTVVKLRGWSVDVLHADRRYSFPLGFPDVPPGSLPWTGWIAAAPEKGRTGASDIRVRARWVVEPYETERGPRSGG